MHIYTLNNDVNNNGVVVLERNTDGSLKEVAGSPFAAGGRGIASPDGFDEQGAVRIYSKYLLTVNPGSDTIAVFEIDAGGGLKPVPGSPFPSGGNTPLSLTVYGDLVYVANQAFGTSNIPNITGFTMDAQGQLTPIPGSTIPFPAGLGPTQVEFKPRGGILAVTAGFQQGGGRIHTYAVQRDGRLQEGPTSPFDTANAAVNNGVGGTIAFSWSLDGQYLLVSNFNGSAIRAFSVDGSTAALAAHGGPVSNNQGATCWTAVSPHGRTLYAANAVSNNISTYAVAQDGTLSLLDPSAPRRNPNGADTKDLLVDPDGKSLYLVGPMSRTIAIFDIGADGLPKELPPPKSPFQLQSGQGTTGLAIGDNSHWSDWGSLGGILTSGPGVASWSTNRLDCFARGTNSAMMHKWWNGQAWSDWGDLGGTITSEPAAVSWGPNRIDCFARGTNSGMMHKWWNGQAWSDWGDLGGTIASGPTVASWGPHRLDCFARGTSGTMVHKWWNGQAWSDWEDLGGVITSEPAAVSWGPYRIDCFARGTSGTMVHTWWNGQSWSAWEDLGGSIVSGPTAASWAPNRIDCFAMGTSGTMVRKWWNGQSWSAWESLGGNIVSRPGAVSWGPNRIDCFAMGTDSTMSHKWWG